MSCKSNTIIYAVYALHIYFLHPKRISKKIIFIYADEIHCRIWKSIMKKIIHLINHSETKVLVTPSHYCSTRYCWTRIVWGLVTSNKILISTTLNHPIIQFFFSFFFFSFELFEEQSGCLSKMENISLKCWMLKRSPLQVWVFNSSSWTIKMHAKNM